MSHIMLRTETPWDTGRDSEFREGGWRQMAIVVLQASWTVRTLSLAC